MPAVLFVTSEPLPREDLERSVLGRQGVVSYSAQGFDEARMLALVARFELMLIDRDLPRAEELVLSLRAAESTRDLSLAVFARGEFQPSEVALLEAGANAVLRLPVDEEWDQRLLKLMSKSSPKRPSRAALLFDSMQEPLAFGARAAAPTARLLLYGKGGRLLKLRVQSQTDSEALSLEGQVVDEHEPERKFPDLPVLVQRGRKTVNQTLTNQSGEFALELESTASFRLVVGMPGPEAIMIALPVAVAVDDES